MRVIAIATGYDGLMVRDPEAFENGKPVVFEMPDGAAGKWFTPVDDEGDPIAQLPKKPKVDKNAPVAGQGPKRGSQQNVPGANKAAADVNTNPLA
jgi:hypothetical protein